MLIRAEKEDDRDAVFTINVLAFASPVEARLVDTLREQVQPLVSLVAEDEGQVVGHIMFSPASLSGYPELELMGLAPLAVAPGHQGKGIGSALVRAGLKACRQLGSSAVVVLGQPEYYSRFGFSPSYRFGIDTDFQAPQEASMVLELQPGALHGKIGRIKYHTAFSNL